jgi:glucose-6-phosphate 1-epimerase
MAAKIQYDSFELKNELTIVEGEGGLPLIKVTNEYAEALVSIYGAQVLSFKPRAATHTESNDLLFLSEKAYFEEGKAIKGGIPICWPWFGQDPEKRGRAAHGFARNVFWEVVKTSSNKLAGTQIVLALQDSDSSKKLWPNSFKLSLTINIGKTLKLSLTTSNTGSQAFSMTQALHTYFSVSDINKVHIIGLDKTQYIDTTEEGWPLLQQHGDVTFDKEVDRIYTQAPELTLVDEGRSQHIRLLSKGSKTTVIWNPWTDISTSSSDLTDEAYQQFACIETANAVDDVIEVLPNESFTLEAEYLFG